MTQQAHTVKTRVWDLPTRLFHLLLMLCVLGLVITGGNGDFAMFVHFYLGYTVLTLVFFPRHLGRFWRVLVTICNFFPQPFLFAFLFT